MHKLSQRLCCALGNAFAVYAARNTDNFSFALCNLKLLGTNSNLLCPKTKTNMPLEPCTVATGHSYGEDWEIVALCAEDVHTVMGVLDNCSVFTQLGIPKGKPSKAA